MLDFFLDRIMYLHFVLLDVCLLSNQQWLQHLAAVSNSRHMNVLAYIGPYRLHI